MDKRVIFMSKNDLNEQNLGNNRQIIAEKKNRCMIKVQQAHS